jgi:GntR family transcriptional regulator
MDFVIDKHSALPAHAQIKEQIKLGLLLGSLRPGDTLPSIRDVEKQVGVSRNIVRRAYLELQDSGILDLRQGKGVLVEKNLKYSHRRRVHEESENLSRDLIARLRKTGICPSAFARYLYQQARESEMQVPFLVFVDASKWLAVERAARISAIWQMQVPAVSMEELAAMDRSRLRSIQKVLTNYLRLDQVQQIVKNTGIEVIPLGLNFTEESISEFSRLPANSSVVLVLDDTDYPSLRLIIELYRKILMPRTSTIESIPRSKVKDFHVFVKSTRYHKVIFSNRVWEDVPDDLRRHPRVTHPHMEADLASLEDARIRAGIIL